MLTQIFGEQTKGIIDEMICEIDHIWTADMKSSEAMIPAVVNTIFAILYFRIPHTLFTPQILHKLLFSNALGDTAYSQEHLKTMVYAKFGGQTKCIMGNSKIENCIEKTEQFRTSTGFEPMTSRYRCDALTN